MDQRKLLLLWCGICMFQWAHADLSKDEIKDAMKKFWDDYIMSGAHLGDRNMTEDLLKFLKGLDAGQNDKKAVDELKELIEKGIKKAVPVRENNVFWCQPLERSSPVPTSVHSLRPGDIKVVGALGDSVTAGTGVTAKTIVQEVVQNRGMSWSGGGQGTFEEHLTMPNILKKYNPSLYGYATGDGKQDSVRAHFNVAVAGSFSRNIAKQARTLVDRMRADANIDYVNDWKVITILTGNNDLCDSCRKPHEYNEAQFYENLVRGLDVLHGELPRTLVNLVDPVHMERARELNKGLVCAAVHHAICECASFPKDEAAEKKISNLRSQFQKTVQEIATSGRYDTRDDFTVVYQPFFKSTDIPRTKDGEPDMSYFAPDCFHLTSKGQAAAGLALWNSMVSSMDNKEALWKPGEKLLCPSEEKPYIYTNRNSHPPAAPITATDTKGHFPTSLLITVTVCGVVVVIIGAAVLVVVINRFRNRALYLQIAQ